MGPLVMKTVLHTHCMGQPGRHTSPDYTSWRLPGLLKSHLGEAAFRMPRAKSSATVVRAIHPLSGFPFSPGFRPDHMVAARGTRGRGRTRDTASG